ncbi:ATP-binding protein [Metabacillus sp. GX 13764]|uniref:ATP-dependent nuclease n=1 Tax=Metabacillus kandeliae TaxID=2900151 RepID=UPI001E4AABBC|nr:ATP-binding protein [Metabacillus kandeliae]MCD7032856.1 ATP-binding protein [Metabacillus kandeliae]
MIKNILLTSHNIINEGELSNLGKINVFIGKNNSGKSTVLKYIEVLNDDIVGLEMDYAYFDELFKMQIDLEIKSTAATLLQDFETLTPKFFLVLKRVVENYNLKVFYKHDLHKFFISVQKELIKEIGEDNYREYFVTIIQETFNSAHSYYFKKLRESPKVLLPVHRQIEFSKKVADLMEADNTGTNILDNLFHYKTQLPSSELYLNYNKIKQLFIEVSNGFDFDIVKDDKNVLELYFTNPLGKWLRADNCGLGLQDLLVILFFANCGNRLLLIDEIESHLHPDMQRRLLKALGDNTDIQYFITTHSNIFLDNNFVDKIFHVSFDTKITLKDATSRSEILNDLGFSITDNLTSDLIILTEGPTDKGVVEEFLNQLGLLNKYIIKTWPLGGDIMNQVDLSVFDGYKIIALIDSDPGSHSIRKKFMKNCEEYGIHVHKLERYSLENYFTIDALKEVFKGQISESIKIIDPNKKIEEQIGMNIKKNNKKIASNMSITDIKDTDLFLFFEEVKKLLNN